MKGDEIETRQAIGFLRHEKMEIVGLQECQNIPSNLVGEFGFEAKWSEKHVLGNAEDRREVEGSSEWMCSDFSQHCCCQFPVASSDYPAASDSPSGPGGRRQHGHRGNQRMTITLARAMLMLTSDSRT